MANGEQPWSCLLPRAREVNSTSLTRAGGGGVCVLCEIQTKSTRTFCQNLKTFSDEIGQCYVQVTDQCVRHSWLGAWWETSRGPGDHRHGVNNPWRCAWPKETGETAEKRLGSCLNYPCRACVTLHLVVQRKHSEFVKRSRAFSKSLRSLLKGPHKLLNMWLPRRHVCGGGEWGCFIYYAKYEWGVVDSKYKVCRMI